MTPPQFPPTPTDHLNGGAPPRKPQPGNELVQPVPLMFAMWQADGPVAGEKAVVMRVSTPLGPLHFILSPDEAIQIAGQLRQQGKAAKSGLTLPPGVHLGDGPDVDLDVDVIRDGTGRQITEADAEALAAEIIMKTDPPAGTTDGGTSS